MASTVRLEGIKEADTNHTAHFSLHTSVTAELKSLVDQSISEATVEFKSESVSFPGTFTYEISYTPTIRGRHELSVKVNDVPVSGSPFKVFVHQPPTQLGEPFRILDGLDWAKGVTIGPQERVYIARDLSYTVSVFDKRPVWVQSIGEIEKRPFGINGPESIATDDDGNLYVITQVGHLLKIDEGGTVVSSLVERGTEPGQFNFPSGVKVHNGNVFVCDTRNRRVQVFDTELNFVKLFGPVIDTSGKEFGRPRDLSFDTEGKIYICEYNCVNIVDENGQYLDCFGKKNGDVELKDARGIQVFGDYVYISEYDNNCISVFKTSDGKFITSFGKYGSGRGELRDPCAIAIDTDGFVYVCDYRNGRVQVF